MTRATTLDMAAFIDAAPSPYHAAREAAERLAAAGSTLLDEATTWELGPGAYHLLRGGSLVAFALPEGVAPGVGLRVIGAHTDSPNLRIKPRANTGSVGLRQLGVEVYGGALLNSWLDRDLGLSGRAIVRDAGAPGGQRTELFLFDEALLRVPQLAIHLDREIHTKGLLLNKQAHMAPIWATGEREERGFEDWLEGRLGLDGGSLIGWDVMCHDLTPSRLIGREQEFLAAPRLDNLCSSYLALASYLDHLEAGLGATIPLIALFDHEEVGSESTTGAAGPLLATVIERVLTAAGCGDRDAFHRSVHASVCCSADMAHATHPNYIDRHEPDHHLAMNGGPVIKLNANNRYATDGTTEAIFQRACERAGVPFQKWVNRTDLACGSTIGSITAARLGMPTVDVGCAQLSMHSARELCGAEDPGLMRGALQEFLRA